MGRNAVLQVALEQPPARLGRGGVAELVAERREPARSAARASSGRLSSSLGPGERYRPAARADGGRRLAPM